MRTTLTLALALLLSGAASAEAGHRHGRDCGHIYDRYARKWVSVNLFGPHGGFSFGYQSAPRYHYHGRKRCYRSHGRWDYRDSYYDRGYYGGHGYYDDRRYRGRDRYFERRYGKRRYYKKHGHHHYGGFCPY